MPEDVPARLSLVEHRIDANDRRIADNAERLAAHDGHIAQLKLDMAEIRAYLGRTATKTDVAEMGARIERAINGILREALGALPVRQAAIWGGVVAIATIGLLLVTLLPR